MRGKGKKASKREATRRVIRTSDASREPMSASRRNYGGGEGSNARLNDQDQPLEDYMEDEPTDDGYNDCGEL